MGMDRTLTFLENKLPSWKAVADLLTQRGLPVQMRMIDGELAFPDEEPPVAWHELRIATSAGMITQKRNGNQVSLIIWGNADPALLHDWEVVATAFTELGA